MGPEWKRDHNMDVYIEEYSSDEAIRKYTSETAGYGISHLLANDYADVYLRACNRYLSSDHNSGLRILEFGCGGGMNLIALIRLLESKGKHIKMAVGSDFSSRLIEAANAEADLLLTEDQRRQTKFVVARNEELAADLARHMALEDEELAGSFDAILGVNTFRYCHRLSREVDCAQSIADLLAPGGVCIMIDMNRRFPAFRSRFRRSDAPKEETAIPTLSEYAGPFEEVNLEILEQGNFCWIPHSAGPRLTRICRLSAPILDKFARPFAMRSLVVSRKRK
jgi:SAM-dependent methyltransferase